MASVKFWPVSKNRTSWYLCVILGSLARLRPGSLLGARALGAEGVFRDFAGCPVSEGGCMFQ